jgi:hypothetical protein
MIEENLNIYIKIKGNRGSIYIMNGKLSRFSIVCPYASFAHNNILVFHDLIWFLLFGISLLIFRRNIPII